MDYTWSDLLNRLMAGGEVPDDEHAWARAQIAVGRATPGQQGLYQAARRTGWNLLDCLASSLDSVENLLRDVPDHVLTISPAAGEWSVRQIVCHLADNEAVNAVRVRQVLTENCPTLVGYDSDVWAARFFELEDSRTALNRWSSMRRNLLKLCATLSQDDWNRVGYLSYRGEESLRVLLGVLVGHDLTHIKQLETVLRVAYPPRRSKGDIISYES